MFKEFIRNNGPPQGPSLKRAKRDSTSGGL